MPLPTDLCDYVQRLTEAGYLLPPLSPPLACERCQRPLPEDKRSFGTCYPCGHEHGGALPKVVAATYAADGTLPYQLLVDAKFSGVSGPALVERVAAIAAALWDAIWRTDTDFFRPHGGDTVVVPSDSRLIERCIAEAIRRGWPQLAVIDALTAAARPKQTDLDATGRRSAAAEKYSCSQVLDGARVLLVDDVYTSGYTLHDAARALRDRGVQSVTGVVFARRIYPDAVALYREATGG